ncbi:DUF1963 domain-containing protein [Pectobacterium brasiliense]|uniref:hypothetical protein n=1 Tax=Pectobacterium brasiliense TaxID=180957 RepID=UPI001969303B|nr:hypothetical protein [Pectobacterium brasiliense]MBN3041812.1 DUF1963 domain-containing protein [Pectobacterium brasiliense]
MFNELVFVEGNTDKDHPYLGSSPFLPASIAWPTDSSGSGLLHLASFPSTFINQHIPDIELDDRLVVSVFTPYSPSSDDYIEKAMNEGGKVLAYIPTNQPLEHHGNPIIPSRRITLLQNPNDDSDENGITKVAGITAWIQDEESHEDLNYILQINNSRLNKAVPSHKGILVGGMGYLLLKKRINGEDLQAGKWIIQAS